MSSPQGALGLPRGFTATPQVRRVTAMSYLSGMACACMSRHLPGLARVPLTRLLHIEHSLQVLTLLRGLGPTLP